MTGRRGRQADEGDGDAVLADLDEAQILAEVLPPGAPPAGVLVGPGDDTAYLAVPSGRVLVTTDAMVLGRDWLDDWSSAADVGAKCVAQNVADIASMGGVTTGVVVTLVADPQTPVRWARDLSYAIADACSAEGIAVLGGDLSSAPAGVRTVSITAIGEVSGAPVLRSGARVGDVVAVSDALGRSGAGLFLLRRDAAARGPLVDYHRRPTPIYAQGPAALRAGATSMLDISDGLLRDAGRIAGASGVRLELRADDLQPYVDALAPEVGAAAWDCVLRGGEEHTLLATFAADVTLPNGWRAIGAVATGTGVTMDGAAQEPGGWDHFHG
ncbi:thiamine-phosphate kinase [Allobranchiibius sp. GilTou38]|uniref:thiamine-phosphate kinase n=1 Tax=Allobranchiibius sp. GilTou38 TaxID=2815210 RepID=UPI001AA0B23F|nr:thiamine-phosphate kinase [Allobranchiibius sp. GilTou38]MBO1765606.1 thiamine-phosphate kinase [Allobranchiibius sp. GilTou38]